MIDLVLFPKNPSSGPYEYKLSNDMYIRMSDGMMYIQCESKTKYIFDLSMFEVIEFSDPVDIL